MSRVHALAGRRGKAYALDCLTYLGIAVATVPFGLLARQAGWGRQRTFVLAASAVPPMIATVLAAHQESSSHAATPGKRLYGLSVLTQEGHSLTFAQALVRNTVKIAIPWQLGHTVAVGAAFGGFDELDPITVGATIVTYPMIAAMIASVVVGQGRTIHDYAVGSEVRLIDGPR